MEKITEGYYPQDIKTTHELAQFLLNRPEQPMECIDGDRDHEVAGADIAKYENESCFTGTAILSVRFRCDLDL